MSAGNQSPDASGNPHAPSAFCTASGPQKSRIQSLKLPLGYSAKPVQTLPGASSSNLATVVAPPPFHSQSGPV